MEGNINIDRPIYNNLTLDNAFNKVDKPKLTCREKANKCLDGVKKKFSCSGTDVANMVQARIPLIKTLRKYNPRTQLLSDAIAGFCVGIIHIPQGMGFAIMSGVPPIYGLYASFWPAFLYVLLGTGHHVSMGTMALTSLMIRTVVDREVARLGLPDTTTTDHLGDKSRNLTLLGSLTRMVIPSEVSELALNSTGYHILPTAGGNVTETFDVEAYKISIVMSLTLLVGIIQLAMGVFRLGVVTTFMPAPFIGGLTTGAAFHIVTSQLKFVLGFTLPPHDGLFKLPLTWVDVLIRIPKIKPAELIIAVLCMTIILVIKIHINQRFKEKMIAPIPPELVVVVLACLVSHFANLHGRYGVQIIKDIPSGMVPPAIPPVDKWFSDYIMDAIMISLMSFSIAFSMGSLFGAKHDYSVDSNQELIALGAIHSIGAFFGSFAGTAAPPRCFILDVTGATTQVSGIITSVFLLFVIFLMGPLFAPLPNAILGAIIIIAVLPLFMQFQSLPNLWRVNKYDFSIWVFSWITVTFLDLSVGLILGIVFSILTVIIQIYRSKGISMTTLADTELFVPSDAYKNAKDLKSVEVFQFQGNLNFVTKEQFKSELRKHMDIQPPEIPPEISNGNIQVPVEKESSDPNANVAENIKEIEVSEKLIPSFKKHSRFLILDFSHISYIDLMGLTTLKKVHTDLQKVGIEVVLACVCPPVMKTIGKSGGKWNNEDQVLVYPSLIDAVTKCRQQAQT